MKTVYLVRHALSTANTEGIVQGHLDYPLSEKGRKQARELRDGFDAAGIRFDLIVSSDLVRAYETARIATGTEAIVRDRGFREIMLGAWQGRNVSELIAQEQMWETWKYCPSSLEIDGAEKLAEVQDRALASLESIFSRDFDKAAVFTHGGVIGLILCAINGEHIDSVWQYRHENTAYSVIEFNAKMTVLSTNNSKHLKEASAFFEKWKFVKRQ